MLYSLSLPQGGDKSPALDCLGTKNKVLCMSTILQNSILLSVALFCPCMDTRLEIIKVIETYFLNVESVVK